MGDPKQAIYSFRSADLPTYLQARARAGATHTLGHNQRSVPALVQGLNALFAENPRAFLLPGLHFHPVQVGDKPRPRLDDLSGEPRAALQCWSLPEGDGHRPPSRSEALAAAASACAAEIARLLQAAQHGLVTLDGRPLAAGDMAVLVRSHAQAARMRQALAALRVGSVEVSQASVFASADAEALERLLLALLSPGRERLLRAALATELMGLDASALARLADDEEALLGWTRFFAEEHQRWRRDGVGAVLRRLLRREDVAERLLSRPDGERRMTNLLHLAELLHEASARHPTPEALLQWLQQQRRRPDGAEAAQLRLDSDRHLVQIVTIHRSKGLEYPLVFCPFLFEGDGGPRRATTPQPCEHHDDQGRLLLDFRDDLPAAEEQARKTALEMAGRAEHLRLVYVALTRAVQHCHLVVGRYCSPSGKGFSTAQSERSALNWLVAGAGVAAEDALTLRHDAPALAAAWQGFAQRHAPAVGLAPLPVADALPLSPPRPDAAQVQALPAPSPLPAGWWLGSYSSLVHGARRAATEDDPRDHDARADGPGAAAAALAALADDDLLRFPRGPAAGDCLHAVFERLDFTRPDGWNSAIAAALRAHPGVTARPGSAPLAQVLLRGVADVLHTPLAVPGAGPLRLADVPPGRRGVELEFTLPSAALPAGALQRLLQQHGVAVPALAFGELRGYLRGFIDLVVEHEGRHLVIDWKSNHLGDTPAHYDNAGLARAMAEHGYGLQALIYCVALHRLLRQRLPGYRYERHHGGALYLFVRGVRPAWGPAGVHAWKPPRALIEAFGALLDGPPAEAAA